MKGIENLKKLEILNLSNNEIEKVENIKGLNNLKSIDKLKGLDFSYNKIISTEGIEELYNLENLYLRNNHIEEIGNLKKLYNLKVLDLSHNKITSMNGIENLYKLKVLYLMNNKIYKLCNLNDLLQLEYLILDKNKISDISKIPVKIKYIDLGRQEIDLKDYKNTENKYSLNTSFIKLRGGEDLDIDYILENGKYDNHTKTIIWENLSTDKLQFEFNNIEDDWMNFSGIVNICLVDKI